MPLSCAKRELELSLLYSILVGFQSSSVGRTIGASTKIRTKDQSVSKSDSGERDDSPFFRGITNVSLRHRAKCSQSLDLEPKVSSEASSDHINPGKQKEASRDGLERKSREPGTQ